MAHVLGAVGILFAFGAGAAADHPYAAESLSGKAPYSIKGSPMGEVVLDVTLDTLLPADTYYLVVNFWSASLTKELGVTYVPKRLDNVDDNGDSVTPAAGALAVPGTDAVATVQPILGTGTGFRFYTITASVPDNPATPDSEAVIGAITPVTQVLTRAFRGDSTDHSGVYQMVVAQGASIAIDTHIRLELGTNLAVPNRNAASYRADLYIYDDLGDARNAARASAPGDVPSNYVFADGDKLFEVKSKLAAPTIEPHLATADVGYERAPTLDDDDNELVSSGGPFRGFEPIADMSTKDVGLLATITLNVATGTFLAAATGENFEGTVNTGARFKVTAAAGSFGFGNGAGQGRKGERTIKGDNPATKDVVETDHPIHTGGAPKAFMVSKNRDCKDGALTLSAPNADGKQVTINPNAETDPTYSKDATQGVVTLAHDGPYYFCVLVSENEEPIPAVGDDRDLDGYKIEVTPMNGTTAGPTKAGNAGSIDRNGTTLNITYLSVHPAYNQRLVVVNRGAREAEFWMDEFQTEEGTMVMNEIRGKVAPKSRMVIRVQDALTVNQGGMSRASGTLNLTAPTQDIDVMTLQVHPGTGQIDTTVYQNETE